MTSLQTQLVALRNFRRFWVVSHYDRQLFRCRDQRFSVKRPAR